MLATLKDKVAREHAALVTIDIQRDFWDPDSPPAKLYGRDVSETESIMDNIVKLLTLARREGLAIIHVRHEEPDWAMSDALKELRLRQAMRTNAGRKIDYKLCQPGTNGVGFYRIALEPTDIVVTKRRYSAFFGTDLQLILRGLNRKSLLFCGGGTSMCLESTVRDAFMMDYYCVVVADCAGTVWGDRVHRNSLENIEMGFGQVSSLNDVASNWVG